MTEKETKLRELIAQLAATPAGFWPATNAKPLSSTKSAGRIALKMLAEGLVHRAESKTNAVGYFSTAKAAAEFTVADKTQRAKTLIGLGIKPAAPVKSSAQVIMPPGVKITVHEGPKYERLDLGRVLRDCAMGAPRRVCRVPQEVAA